MSDGNGDRPPEIPERIIRPGVALTRGQPIKGFELYGNLLDKPMDVITIEGSLTPPTVGLVECEHGYVSIPIIVGVRKTGIVKPGAGARNLFLT